MAATIKITAATLVPNPVEVKMTFMISVMVEPEIFEITDANGDSIVCSDGYILACAEE